MQRPAKRMNDKAEYLSTLKVATILGSQILRKDAMMRLRRQLDEMELVVLGRKYTSPTWVREGYKKLVSRTETITDEEAYLLGLLTTVRLLRLREGGHFKGSTSESPDFASPLLVAELEAKIDAVFKVEFSELQLEASLIESGFFDVL